MSFPQLRFIEFSAPWSTEKLSQLIQSMDSGWSPLCEAYPAKVNEWGVLKTTSTTWDGFNENENKKLPEKLQPRTQYELKDNDILITRAGPTERVGVVSHVSKTRSKLIISDKLIRLKCNNNIHSKFLSILLSTKKVQAQLAGKKSGLASAQTNISQAILANLTLVIPELSEQAKIANFLTAVDEKITQLTQKYELLAQYKRGVMQQIFSQELRFKNENGQDFPEWEDKSLDNVCECLDNKRKPLNDAERQKMQGEYPYWGANNIMDYVNDFIFDETIVLLAEDGGNFNEYKTRPIANISRGKCWVNNHTHVLKGKASLSNEFLFYSLVHKNITGYVSGGTRAKLTKGEMLKIMIDVPSLEEQTKIANFLTAIDDKLTHTQDQLVAAKQYKQGLLQQMFV